MKEDIYITYSSSNHSNCTPSNRPNTLSLAQLLCEEFTELKGTVAFAMTRQLLVGLETWPSPGDDDWAQKRRHKEKLNETLACHIQKDTERASFNENGG